MINNDTIAAIATGLTDSGIGIIRVSGKNAIKTCNKLFRTKSGKEILNNVESHTLHYGYVVEIYEEKEYDWKHHIIDEVMIAVMKSPRSFTGEDTVEIQCHGGILVMKKILSEVIKAGARLAEPGEFTKRAFLNGRIDLTRAEAVMDVIHSQNEMALMSSVSQLRGNLFEVIKELRNKIIYEIAFIESALDDPEHISLEGYYESLSDKLDSFIIEVKKLVDSADCGKLMKEGINTVIIGKPNAGKSSLLNLLIGEERAIVTDIAGTTRDILKESIKLHGIHFNLVDTAGIRETEDIVEKIGVDKAKKFAKEADLVLYVVDMSVPLDESDKKIIDSIVDKNVIILMNKSDLKPVIEEKDVKKVIDKYNNKGKVRFIKTSAKENEGIDEFENTVKEMFFKGEIKSNNELMITNLRHKEALIQTLNSLELVKQSIDNELPEDFLSIDLMNAYAALGRIIGEEVDDDLVEEIFSKFCMGK